jgi:hypothetical protein
MKKILTFSVLLFIAFNLAIGREDPLKKRGEEFFFKATAAGVTQTIMDVNNITSWISVISSPGGLGWPPLIRNSYNGTFPRGSGVGMIYREGLMIGGLVNDGSLPVLRAQGVFYRTSMIPGKITAQGQAENPSDPNVSRVWRVRPDYKTADLRADAAEFFQKPLKDVTDADVAAVRQQYENDWMDWPASKGAPWYTTTGPDAYQVKYGPGFDPNNPNHVPGIPGANQTVWTVANDLNSDIGIQVFGSPSIGLELQVTEWAYSVSNPLNNIIFQQFRIIYKGTAISNPGSRIDSMYIVKWSDPDLGNYSDDLAGCDSVLGLGFVYNANTVDAEYQALGYPAPAVGFDFLQGPAYYTGNPNDSAVIGLKWRKGYKYWSENALSAFVFFAAGTGISDPGNQYEWYNLMRAGLPRPAYPDYRPFWTAFRDGYPTKYAVAGDPVTRTGWIDGREIPPGDRRIVLVTGPFSMSLGDTAEIVVALIGAMGADNISSIQVLKYYDSYAQFAYDNLFVLPSPPPSPNVKVAQLDRQIVLNWGWDEKSVNSIENFNSAGFSFEGYNVYQLPSPNASLSEAVKIATYDLVNDVTVILDRTIDPKTGVLLLVPVQTGSNSGIKRYIDLKTDYVRQRPLVNGQTYYYAVTAYAFSPDPTSPFRALESTPVVLAVTPQSPPPGTRYYGTIGDTIKAVRKQGKSDGEVFGLIVDPTRLTGHTYEVRFEEVGGEITWKLIDKTANQTKLTGQKNQSGDDLYLVVDGIQFKVVGPPPGPKGWEWTKGTRKLTWGNADIMTTFGLPEYLFTFNGAFGYISPYGLFTSGREHSDVVTPDKLRNIKIVFATTDVSGNFNPAHQNASFGYRYLRRASAAPAKPEFAPFIKNPSGGYAFQEFGLDGQPNVPLAVYDIEANPPRRLAVGFLENNVANGLVDGKYWPGDFNIYDNVDASGPREWLFIFDVDYSTTQSADLSKDILNNDLPVMYMATWNRRGNVAFSDADELVIYANHPNTVNDVFEITAPSAPAYSVETAKEDVEKINAFPNPYYGFNLIETDRLVKYITFNHLPKKATIRIFNLAGVLVRTIYKDDDTQFARWDLRNEQNLPVASGIYIAHIDMPEIGKTKIVKLMIVQEEEFLPVY